ncbi:MAG: RNA polymerase factor sigma-54 [Planctomycetia bacterium]|nr:RNA polymerase factor sigma-54 [Planctomycetia bacterium]
MGIGLGQEIRLEQKTVLSQRLIQSMELLQLPLLQLDERIDQEIAENPVLEQRSDSGDGHEDESYVESEADVPGMENPISHPTSDVASDKDAEVPADAIDHSSEGVEEFQVAADFESLYGDMTDESPARSQNWLEDASSRHSDLINSVTSPGETLSDHLMEQLRWFDLTPEKFSLCEKIIYNLDANGYLREPVSSLLPKDATKEERQAVRAALTFVQTLEPKGVGARTLQECLLLQIGPELPLAQEMRCLISQHAEDIEKNRFPQISRKTGYSFELIERILEEIRQLNPRPGAAFRRSENVVIQPDVYVEQMQDGSLQVRTARGRGSNLYISPYYREIYKQKATDPETKNFLRKKMSSARWLMEAIQQRQSTLQRVAEEIVEYQKDYFTQGSKALRPLTRQQIADKVHLHVTTVSRACAGKWLQSPQGIVELAHFFSGAIAKTEAPAPFYPAVVQGSEDDLDCVFSQNTVRSRIKELVAGEDKQSPLSDEEMVILLKKEGIKIERRTVAKYRQSLKIPSSRQRRSWK